MTARVKAPVRLALRVEGNWWVAYLALGESMQGAHELGRVLMGIVADPDNKRMFMELMAKVVSDSIQHKLGVRPEMIEQPAPEHEKSGHG